MEILNRSLTSRDSTPWSPDYQRWLVQPPSRQTVRPTLRGSPPSSIVHPMGLHDRGSGASCSVPDQMRTPQQYSRG
jgi:hypothetical protein